MIRALDSLRKEVDELMSDTDAWLDTLTVRCPAGVESDAWSRAVTELLEDLRLDGVTVVTEPTPGPPWIGGARFTEGWAE